MADSARAVSLGDRELRDPARLALTDAISICGDSEMCVDAVRQLAVAGADTIVLAAHEDELEGQLERFVHDVMPLLTPVS